MKQISINPCTEEINAEFDTLSYNQSVKEIEKIKDNSQNWASLSVQERLTYIKKVSKILQKNKKKYAEIMTKEVGKTIKEAIAEVEKCALLCDYYIENAQKFLKPEIVKTEFKKSYVVFEPMGVVFAIMPWNFPFWQAFRCAIPSIIAGNSCVLKHASNVPMSALEIESIFKEAGINIFKTLLIDSKTAMKLIENDKVDAVSLTGSNLAGSQVGEVAGKQVKKVVLELGGSDPFIVLEDADIEEAAKQGIKSRLVNIGQSCISAKRFIVIKSVAKKFYEEYVKNLETLKMGDPTDPETDIGPVARKEFAEELEKQLFDSKEKCEKIFRLERKPSKGFFVQPTCVLNPDLNSKLVKEEVFGPIASIIVVKDEEEAIKVANQTEFGLGASIWTSDLERGERLSRRIMSGVVAVNKMVRSDPRLPFGGVKKSGIGRELSHYGLKEFTNIKSIIINDI